MTTKNSVSSVIGNASFAEFESSLAGEMIRPNDAGYDEARRVWNGMIDRHPGLVVRCAEIADVIKSVQFARSHSLRVAVRGGGHNVAGFATCDDGIVIDLSPLKKIDVDPQSRTARAQAGLTWGEFDAATQVHSLATTGGLVSTTGIAGFTTGGGIGWLMRKHGLALDNLLSAEMVLADGSRLHSDENQNADLFWGVRGGGGNFGIVTEFTYRLHPVGPTIFGGAIFHPISRAGELLQFYSEWAHTLPDECTTMVVLLTAPPAPFVPESSQGTKMIAVAMCHCGRLEDGASLAKPLQEFAPPAIDLLGPHPYLGLQTMFDASAPRGMLAYWKTEYLSALESNTIRHVVQRAEEMPMGLSAIHIHHVQGRVSRIASDATAFGHRDEPFVLNIIGGWMNPAETDSGMTWVRKTAQTMHSHSTGGAYLNFLGDEGEVRVQAAYGAENYKRLVELKKRYDPTNFFQLNQNIKPA